MSTDVPPEPQSPLARRWWLNVALLVVVAGLAALAWHLIGAERRDTRPILTDIDPIPFIASRSRKKTRASSC